MRGEGGSEELGGSKLAQSKKKQPRTCKGMFKSRQHFLSTEFQRLLRGVATLANSEPES